MKLRILRNSQDFPRRIPGASKTTIAKWSSEYYRIPKISLEESKVLQKQPLPNEAQNTKEFPRFS